MPEDTLQFTLRHKDKGLFKVLKTESQVNRFKGQVQAFSLVVTDQVRSLINSS